MSNCFPQPYDLPPTPYGKSGNVLIYCVHWTHAVNTLDYCSLHTNYFSMQRYSRYPSIRTSIHLAGKLQSLLGLIFGLNLKSKMATQPFL